MEKNRTYKCLQQQVYTDGNYAIVPIRDEDKYKIMQWRNEQMYHLRQTELLTRERQEAYFKNVVSKLFEQKQPDQILFSYLEGGKCIGYGGLVHIDWQKQSAEVSFIMATHLEKQHFEKHWSQFLRLLFQVAFDELCFKELHTFAYDVRQNLYEILEKNSFVFEKKIKNNESDIIIHKIKNMNFKSERLHLIPFNQKFLNEKILNWFEKKDLMRYYTNSKVKITKSKLIESIQQGKINADNFTYFVVHTESKQIIGMIKIGPINKAHKISDLVTLIGERGKYGKGIGTEAIKLGIELAFEKYDIRKLYGGMYASNVASIKAYTKAGWIVEGILKGHYLNGDENEDRILVGCFNPKYFNSDYIENAKYKEWYENIPT